MKGMVAMRSNAIEILVMVGGCQCGGICATIKWRVDCMRDVLRSSIKGLPVMWREGMVALWLGSIRLRNGKMDQRSLG